GLARGLGGAVGRPVGLGLGLGLRLRLGRGGALGLAVAVGLAGPAVVGLVEPAALEDDRAPAPEQADELGLLTPRALGQRRLGERLQLVERVPAGGAFVVVGRHTATLRVGNSKSEARNSKQYRTPNPAE